MSDIQTNIHQIIVQVFRDAHNACRLVEMLLCSFADETRFALLTERSQAFIAIN